MIFGFYFTLIPYLCPVIVEKKYFCTNIGKA